MIYGGSVGVELFFWLSGFVLFLPHAENRAPALRTFAVRRLAKIVPSYYLALVVIAFVFVQPQNVAAGRPLELVRHALFIHSFDYDSMYAVVSAFWSLAIEAQFYVLFPLLAACMYRRALPTFLACLAVGEGFRLYLQLRGLNGSFYWICQLPANIDVFGAGMFCAWLFARTKRPSARLATIVAVVSLLLGLALMRQFSDVTIAQNYTAHQAYQNDHRFVFELVISGLGLGSLWALRPWRAIVANPLLVWLSSISYNLYLWHEAIVSQCARTGFPCSGTPAPWLWDPHWTTHFFFWYVGISIAVAWTLTQSVEVPILRWARRRWPDPPFATAPVAARSRPRQV